MTASAAAAAAPGHRQVSATAHVDGRQDLPRRNRLDAAELRRLSAELEADGPEAVVRWMLQRIGRDRVAVVTALQIDGVAVASMALEVDPHVRIVTIDTGRLPTETLEYLDTLRAHWGRDIEVVRPTPTRVLELVRDHGPTPFYTSPELRRRCCAVRKVEALDSLMHGLDGWLAGLRRDHSPARSAIPAVGEDPRWPGVLKACPLAAWSEDAVREFLLVRGIAQHPLYSRGYQTIGCAPCTRPVNPGHSIRSGRWWWEEGSDRECGLHVLPSAVGARRG